MAKSLLHEVLRLVEAHNYWNLDWTKPPRIHLCVRVSDPLKTVFFIYLDQFFNIFNISLVPRHHLPTGTKQIITDPVCGYAYLCEKKEITLSYFLGYFLDSYI